MIINVGAMIATQVACTTAMNTMRRNARRCEEEEKERRRRLAEMEKERREKEGE